jgi:hypothetical protein
MVWLEELGHLNNPSNDLISHKAKTKKYYQKHFHHLTDICCLNSYSQIIKKKAAFSRMDFQVKCMENLISKYHITEERPLGRPPKTAPPPRMNAASVKAKSVLALCYVLQNELMS